MLKFFYMVYDSVAGAMSGPIMVYPSDAVAIRDFSDAVRGNGSLLAQHPDDFSLVRVGTIDAVGAIAPLDHESVITARTVVDIMTREVSNV